MLVLFTNRNLHMGCRSVAKSVTLSDLERPYGRHYALFHTKYGTTFVANGVKFTESRSMLSATNVAHESSSGNIGLWGTTHGGSWTSLMGNTLRSIFSFGFEHNYSRNAQSIASLKTISLYRSKMRNLRHWMSVTAGGEICLLKLSQHPPRRRRNITWACNRRHTL